MANTLLQFTGHSIYCPIADVHIDPWKPVDRAIITHAHSDHAKWGSKKYLAHHDSKVLLKLRLGEDIHLQTIAYNEPLSINGVNFSLHPAGHILGSAQVRVENKGEVWVVSGDYKLQDDHFCTPFEPVKCHSFITEATFALPIYKWQPQTTVMEEINQWYVKNKELGICSLLTGYALGKMQRILKNMNFQDEPIYAHGAVYILNEKLREAGYDLPPLTLVTKEMDKKLFTGALVLAPPLATGTPWTKKFGAFSLGYCSGWMAIRGAKNRRAIDQGFVLSDHVDWNELHSAIKQTEAEKVYVTHGFTNVFSRWLNEIGIPSAEVKTMYGDEEGEEDPEGLKNITPEDPAS